MIEFNKEIFKGDAINIDITLDETITSNYKINAKIYDSHGHEIDLDTQNNGGEENEINILILSSGTFRINLEKDLTTDFDGATTMLQVTIWTDGTPSKKYTAFNTNFPLLCRKT